MNEFCFEEEKESVASVFVVNDLVTSEVIYNNAKVNGTVIMSTFDKSSTEAE